MADQGLLKGFRVLDVSRLLPGAWCTRQLAELGAEVIKIETPLAGDYMRMAPAELGFGGIFEAVNQGKRSFAVNYRLPRGRQVLLRLAETADVFVESSLPGQMARRGLGPEDVRAVNPRLVYCSLTGYGQDGPYRDLPAHDLNFLATSGILALLHDGGLPAPPGVPLADLAGGALATTQILAALVRRERSGEGATLDVAIMDAVVAWLAVLGDRLDRDDWAMGPFNGRFPCYAAYRAKDGRMLAVAAFEPHLWVNFCRAVGRDDLVAHQFDRGARDEVAAILATRPRDHWLTELADACVSAVNTPAEAVRDPQIVARGLVGRSATGSVRLVAHRQTSTPDDPAPDAPVLGADTFSVLGAAGATGEEMAALAAAGVIAGPASAEATARAKRLGAVLATIAARAARRAASG
jgi:crotonobetainyl-CoA:carnitine CoA-transferase CaiB-like acyl-CoA transferase